MSALTAFHDNLLPELPGCTAAMVDFHLRAAAREFCRKTSAWRQTLTAIDTVAGQAAYTLLLPADSQLVRVTELSVAAVLLWRDRDVEPPADANAVRPKYGVTEPPFSLDANLTTLTLGTDEIPTAAVTGGLLVVAALTPTAAAAAVPDFLLSQYSEALRFGTLFRLMAMGKKSWTDRELAVEYRTNWNAQLNLAAYQAQVGNTRHQLRTRKTPV